MVQSLNTKALLTLASVARRPALLVPHVSVVNVSAVNYTALQQHAGIEAVVFDKDHTLTAPYVNVVHDMAQSGLERCVAVFGRERVAILSNSAGTLDDVDYLDAQQLEAALGLKVIRHAEKKPGGLSEVLAHFGLDDPAKICMVGDRLLTDIVFGNLHGMLTVHTLPFPDPPTHNNDTDDTNDTDDKSETPPETLPHDNWTAKLLRPWENRILYSDWMGGRALQKRRPPHKYWPGPDAFSLEWNEEEVNEDSPPTPSSVASSSSSSS
jgi:phosphatidylglycerophosphatase GEP4